MAGVGALTIFDLLLIGTTQAAKFLIMSVPVYSHCSEVSGVGQALADRGHQVYILLGSTFNHKYCYDRYSNGTNRITPILFEDSPYVTTPNDLADTITKAAREGEGFSFLREIKLLQEFSRTACGNIFYDKEGFERLKAEHFDLVIVDTVPFDYCFFVLPYKLGVPYVGVSTYFEDFVSGRPFLPSIVPSTVMSYTDSMTFSERFINALSYIGITVVSMYVMAMDALTDIAPELSRIDLVNLATKCELYLYNYDVILGYPVPVMPNHVFIGGIAAGLAKPLPAALENYYKKSANGVVLVTFGSNLDGLPKKREEILKRVFKRLDADILWKHNTEEDDGNIKFVRWLPQNDLLGNPKTKVFVSHCGNNGVFEALYHGVPLVCTVVYGDQIFNGGRVQHWKVGLTLPLLTASEEELFAAINAVLSDPLYRSNMKRTSQMYHSQPMTARERAAFWVEYVLKFSGGHLRSRGSEMSTFTYMGYDLVCFVFGVLVAVFFIGLRCCKCCYKRFRKPKKLKTN